MLVIQQKHGRRGRLRLKHEALGRVAFEIHRAAGGICCRVRWRRQRAGHQHRLLGIEFLVRQLREGRVVVCADLPL